MTLMGWKQQRKRGKLAVRPSLPIGRIRAAAVVSLPRWALQMCHLARPLSWAFGRSGASQAFLPLT